MRAALSRRSFLTVTAGAAVVAACSSPKPGEVAKDGSVTVKHIFGETKVPAPPKRVVSAGFTEQDDLLAVGIVPIAVTDWFAASRSAYGLGRSPNWVAHSPSCSTSMTASRWIRSRR